MTRKTLVLASVCAVVAVMAFVAVAQDKPGMPPKTPPVPETTVIGKVVDLHCFMVGKHMGEDPVKCTQKCIEMGVPAALETPKGLIILGKGMENAAKMLAPLAMQEVEAKGHLYEKAGVKYLDITTVAKKAAAPEKPVAAKPDEKPAAEPEKKPGH